MTLALLTLAPLLLASGQEAQRVRLAEAWPELTRSARKEVARDVARLRAARTPEMTAGAHADLVAAGAGAAPELFRALGKERQEAARERLEGVLAAVLAPEHAGLVAQHFEEDSAAVRAFALECAATWREPRIRDAAEAALARVREAKRPDPRERAAAALCATACGSTDGLEVLLEVARTDWKRRGEALRAALESVRGPEATARLGAHLQDDRRTTVAALRLLAGCGDASARPLVRPLLDSSDNSIRVAAINACRGIVDGAPPLEKLPVFDAIERARAWKERL